MSKWFRWYEGTCEDGKFRFVARNANVTVATVMGVWACLLEDASNDRHRGVATRGEDFYAAILDLAPEQLQSILEAMDDIGLISAGHGNITITKWKERQFETDTTDGTNAERQRRWREKHKPNGNVTERNGSVTARKRPDTDTDTDTDKKELGAVEATRPADKDFEEFWKAYPRRMGANPKAPAEKLFAAAVKSGAAAADIIAGAKRCAAVDAAKINTEFIPQAVKWLRDKRWRDYLEAEPTSDFVPDWDGQIVRWLRGQKWSTRWYGAEPGQPGCRVPQEFLTKHGVLSEDRKIFAA